MSNNTHTNQKTIDLVNNLNLKSKRLCIRKFRLCDVQDNIIHEMDQSIMRYIRDPTSVEETTAKTMSVVPDWSGAESDWVLLSLKHIISGDYIGMVSLRYESIENDTIELGWRLGTNHQGQGLATEAARAVLDFITTEIKPHKVVAYCIAENTGSSNIMSKLGMQVEARFKQYSRLGGKWCDEDMYGLILN